MLKFIKISRFPLLITSNYLGSTVAYWFVYFYFLLLSDMYIKGGREKEGVRKREKKGTP